MAFPPHILPPTTPLLSRGAPEPAPPGSIFVIGDEHGWASPPRKYTLDFGREEDVVCVPLGVDDDRISREHGVFECYGQQWWLENRGRLPIKVPGRRKLLRGHGWTVPTGYTPLMIASDRRTHILHVFVVGQKHRITDRKPTARTKNPEFYSLKRKELMVLAALAQHYLRDEPRPQPATWANTTAMLNSIPGAEQWDPRRVENLVGRIRRRLGIPGTSQKDVCQPVGNALNENLIEALLDSGYLLPEDLEQFETEAESLA